MRSPHDADTFMKVVLPRMQGYVNSSIPARPQLRRGERRMEERGDQRVAVYRAAAEYLSTINLGSGSQWTYALKTLPRPSGRATRVIYTEYDLGREVIQPHDVIVDADGIAWYSSFGEQNLGRLDPKTGAVKEYPVPLHKPDFPTGFLGLRDDKAGNLWLGNMFQATIVKFDRKTEKLQYWTLPEEQNIDSAQVNMVSPQSSHVDGKVWTQNNGFAGVHRLDLATGKIETWEPFKNAKEPHNIYDVIPDSKNNAYFTDFRHRHIGRIDAKTGEVKLFEVPTPASAPRRGMMDAQDRLWFGEYRGDRIGDVRHQDRAIQGMEDRAPLVGTLRRLPRQERRGVDRLDDHRPGHTPQYQVGGNGRLPAATPDQYPPRVRRQLDHAGHVLGRFEPRRVHHQAGAAGLGEERAPPRVAPVTGDRKDPASSRAPDGQQAAARVASTALAQSLPSSRATPPGTATREYTGYPEARCHRGRKAGCAKCRRKHCCRWARSSTKAGSDCCL